MAEGDLGAGSSSSSPPDLLSKMSDNNNTSASSSGASNNTNTNNSNSNGLWGSILERSRTAPLPDEYAFDGGGASAAAWGGGHANNNTGNNNGGNNGGSNGNNSNPAAGPDHAGGSSPPRGGRPGLGFIDEYGGPSGTNNNVGVGSGHQTMGQALTSPSSRTASGGSRLPPGLSAAESTDSAGQQQQQFLFEAAGSGLRRPASTGIMLEQPTTGSHGGAAAAQAQAHGHGSLVMASAEVLKSLGLEIPGYTGSAAGSGAAGNDGGGEASNAAPQGDTTSASAADDGAAAAAAQQLPRSGSALMTLIQEEMRSGRASAATPAMERSASAAPAEPSVDEIGAGLQGLQVAQKQEPTAQGQSQSTSSRPTQYSQYHPSPHRNSQQHQQQYQYPNQQQQQQQYEQLPHQHQQAAIYHQPSPVFTGMSPHNSPPEMFLGQHGAPVSPHGHVQHQMYGHLPPSAVAYGQAGTAPQQQHQPPPAQQHSQAQTQPPQPQTVYYTQGPNGQMQAVYVNTAAAAPQPYGHIPPPPPAAMPHGYGYATIQYHPGPPPPSQQGGGGHHHQHHPQQQARPQVLHVDANGQPIAATAPAAPTTAYAYYPGTGQYAPVSTAANSHGGQPVVIANAGGAPPSMGYQYSGGGNGGGGGGGSPRHGRSNHHHQGGMGGSGHGGRSSRYGGGGRSNNSGGGGGYNSNRGGVDGSGTNHPSSHRHRSNTGSSATNSGPTNPMLEEFRHNKSSASTWSVSDIRGHVVDFCRDQNGSRFIQQRLEVAPPAEKDLVMEELLAASGGDGLAALCGDVFGNYVVQKLLEVGDAKILEQIYEGALVGHMMELSMQMYGCRVVQRSFEMLPSKHFPALLQEFKDNKVVACIHDSNGNHVMQKAIESLSNKAKFALKKGDTETAYYLRDCIQFIIDDIIKNIAPLSCHPYGCRVLQRILEHCIEPQKSDILDALMTCHKVLLDDQYGNYVIQHVLQHGRVEDRQSLLGIIVAGGILTLSRQKFASNVVEKLLKFGNAEQRVGVVSAMLQTVHDDSVPSISPGGTPVVILMVRDAYANYVVQTALDVCPPSPEREELLSVLNANLMTLRQFTFAKHIVAKLGA